MGQLLLPLFPKNTLFLTSTLGVQEERGTVVYFHSGAPIHSHQKDDLNKFRYITSYLLLQGLCSNKDIVRVFHVSTDSVRRYKNQLFTKGEGSFLVPTNDMEAVINYCQLCLSGSN